MALLDDPNFIIAHLRHAFITSDDTGMCEVAIMNEDVDWPERKRELEEKRKKPWSQFYNVDPDQTFDDLDIYADSYEIESSFDYGFRQRSNTAVRLEKLRQDRMVQNQCKKVQWKDDGMEFPDMSEEELDDLFKKKKVRKPFVPKSSLSQQLEQCPAVASNPFSEYAKFDGKAQVGGSHVIKQIDIYLDMCEGDAREFPMELHVMGTARVIDVIGLICWHYVNDGYEPPLSENVEHYALMIAEEDGEVDTDFPALDNKEAISKFGFNTLALIEKEIPKPAAVDQPEGKLLVTVRSSDGESRIAVESMSVTVKIIMDKALKKRKGIIPTAGPDYILEKEDEPGVPLDLDKKLSDCGTMCFLMVREHSKREYSKEHRSRHVSTGDPPLVLSTQYHSYRLHMLHKLRPTSEIQLGISGDKIEIDPVRTQPKNTANMAAKKFWGKQKAVSIESDRLADCLITEEKLSGKAIFRLTYKSASNDFRHHDFETDQVTAKRIVTKMQQIVELRSSTVRNDYNMWKERRQSSKKHDK